MNISTFLRKNILYITFVFFLCSCLFLLLQESFGRGLFILLSLFAWVLLLFFTKKGITASILYILIVLPFNITYQLPHSISLLGTETVLYDPYVGGVFVNYLVPTISILDLGLFLLILSIVKEIKISKLKEIFLPFKWYLLVFVGFLLLQNIFLFDILIILNSVRFLSIIFLIIYIPKIIDFLRFKYLQLSILLILFANTLFQGIVGIIQFSGGSSLGLKWLGESQVVSGMQGSSFIELFDGLFLRAYGTFPHPNVFAGFLLLTSLLSLYFFFEMEKKYRLLSILLLLSSCVFVIFTFSRIVICLFIFNILLFVFILIRKERKLFSFSPLLVVERFVNLFTGGDTSLTDRVKLFKSSISVLKENWLLGTGSGDFVKAMDGYIPRTASGIQLLQPVHNVFMLLLTDLGVFGFVSFVALFYKICVVNMKRITVLIIMIATSLLVLSMFDHYFLSLPQGIVMLGIFIVLLFKESKTLNNDKNNVYKN